MGIWIWKASLLPPSILLLSVYKLTCRMCAHATLSSTRGLVRFLFFCFHNAYTCHPKQYSWTSTFFIMRTHATVYICHPEFNMPVSFSCRRWVQSRMSSVHHDSLTPCWPYRQWGQTKHNLISNQSDCQSLSAGKEADKKRSSVIN